MRLVLDGQPDPVPGSLEHFLQSRHALAREFTVEQAADVPRLVVARVESPTRAAAADPARSRIVHHDHCPILRALNVDLGPVSPTFAALRIAATVFSGARSEPPR